MRCDVTKDRGQGADSKLIVVGNGDVVLSRLVASKPQMTTGLSGDAVAKNREGFGEFRPGNVPGQFHAAMTSSRT